MMDYALDTLEIERGRLVRALRAFEELPEQSGEVWNREVLLRQHRKAIDEAILSLTSPTEASQREIDPSLDLAYPTETLRAERARLMMGVRRLRSTEESAGVVFPAERIEEHERTIRELREAAALLEEIFARRARLGFT